jgi:hypothetical protein
MAGITITQPSAARLTTIKDEDSTHSITPPATAHDEKRVNIYTTHSYSSNTPPRSSMEVYKSESKTGIIANLDVDLEAGHRSFDANGGGISLLPSKIGKVCTKDPAWPSREDQKKEMLQMKRNRACCGWWAGLTTKKRNWAKTIIFFLVCGLLVGIAVSITRAVGGGVFSGDNTNKPIGGSS